MKKDKKDYIKFKWNWKVFWAVIILIGIIIWGFNHVQQENNTTNPSQSDNSYTPNQYVSPEQQCHNSGGTWCNGQCYNGKCPMGEQLLCLPYGQPVCITPQQPLNYNFQSSTDQEPYYSAYCDKINPYDLGVRQAEAEAIKNDSGSYSINQLFDIYDWVKTNIEYQNVPLTISAPYPPNQTLLTETGDCKNQAVLIASMIEAVGGTAQVVADPTCVHAYAIVYIGSLNTTLAEFDQAIENHYGSGTTVNYLTLNNSIWVIFDPAGGLYPGDTLPQCEVNGTTKYLIDSCLSCAENNPSTPYTFNLECYSQCPSGTISTNGYSCSACPSGYSYNNQCVSCQSGYILGQDGQCHQPCGSPTTYCSSEAYCYNNQCVTCPSGTVLHTDGRCYPN